MTEKVNKGTWYTLGLASASGGTPTTAKKWYECTKSSNWRGENARDRMMNALSTNFDRSKFEEYISWQKNKRGCDYVNLFVTNEGNGEGAGYSIWGTTPFSRKVPNDTSKMMIDRMRYCVKQGLGVWVWLMADESDGYNSQILSRPNDFSRDLAAGGFLDPSLVSGVILGLEMNEYCKSDENVINLRDAVKKNWHGVIGTHHGSGNLDYAKYGDVIFYQTNTGMDPWFISRLVDTVAKDYKKPVCAFEIEREPAREKCEIIMEHSEAFSVGNW